MRNRHRVGERDRHVREQLLHLRLRLEVLLLRVAARPTRVGERVALGNADARFMRDGSLLLEELDRMRRNDRQRQLTRPSASAAASVRRRARGPCDAVRGSSGPETRPPAAAQRVSRASSLPARMQGADVAVTPSRQRDQARCQRARPVPRTSRAALRRDCDAGSRGTPASAGDTGSGSPCDPGPGAARRSGLSRSASFVIHRSQPRSA